MRANSRGNSAAKDRMAAIFVSADAGGKFQKENKRDAATDALVRGSCALTQPLFDLLSTIATKASARFAASIQASRRG